MAKIHVHATEGIGIGGAAEKASLPEDILSADADHGNIHHFLYVNSLRKWHDR